MILEAVFGTIGAVLLILVCFYLYLKLTKGKCKSKRDLSGKIAIVTGANCGIGLETARDFARRNATVILACRNVKTGRQAAQDITTTTGNDKIEVYPLDLSNFSSVREFADIILRTHHKLDILVNNAGVMYLQNITYNEQGINILMATNHFGHFLLTNLLLPLLKKGAPSRIVVVSSMAHSSGVIDIANIKGDISEGWWKLYSHSKLANVLFSLELSKRLAGTGVTCNSLHPGAILTNLQREFSGCIMKAFFSLNNTLFFKTVVEGAQTSIYVAVDEKVDNVTGKYFSDCKIKAPARSATDEDMARKLWKVSLELTGLAE